uniref:Uncharacterized protein n=1 Tax=Mycena chlorophos TaxID=658473 RepID=A0ABQ0M769_MYCCL|nr:predicted protein [Mycena chlorophos]
MGWLPDDDLRALIMALADANLGGNMVEQHRRLSGSRNIVRLLVASALAWTSSTFDLDLVKGGKYDWRNRAYIGQAMNAHFKANFRSAVRMGDVGLDIRLLQEEWYKATNSARQATGNVPVVLCGHGRGG